MSNIECKICNKNFTGIRALSSHIRQSHCSTKEYYDKYIKKENEGVCPVCGAKTKFKKFSVGYNICCSVKCSNSYDIRNNKISKSLLENEDHIQKSKENLIAYNKSEKGRKKSSEIGKIWGSFSLKKAHSKYDKICLCDRCNKETLHMIGVGCVNCWSKDAEEKIKIATKEKYNVDNVFQLDWVKEKIKNTSLDKYNCENPGNSREARIKAAKTMRNNDNDSSWEDLFEQKLIELNIDYKKKYSDNRYPFLCDFYLPKTDTFVEINGYWSHNTHFFNKNSAEDIKILNDWKEKANKGHKQYENAVEVWSNKDVKKLNYAINNNLNYIVLWSIKDIYNYLEELAI